MRSGPQTSSAATTRLPRTNTFALISSRRSSWKAGEAETCNPTRPHLCKQRPPTTAPHHLTRPNRGTAAQALRQRRPRLLLILQRRAHQARGSAGLSRPRSTLCRRWTPPPNLPLSLRRPPIPQRLLLCLPLWHRPFPGLRATLKPKAPEPQDQHMSPDHPRKPKNLQ